jgi:molybdate transport system permease protein
MRVRPEAVTILRARCAVAITSMDLQALWLTIRLATLVALSLLALGLPVAYWITYSEWRWKFLIEAIVALPLVLPPTVLGFYLLIALGPRSPLGRWWQALTGHTLVFTFEGLLVGSILYSLPFAVQPFAAGFAAVDRRLLAASEVLGASRSRTFLRIILPLSAPGVVTGAALSFAHTLGEFGLVLMVGGNIPGATRTVSIDIYDKVQAVDYSAANQTALVLLVISFLLLSGVYAVNRGVGPMGSLAQTGIPHEELSDGATGA